MPGNALVGSPFGAISQCSCSSSQASWVYSSLMGHRCLLHRQRRGHSLSWPYRHGEQSFSTLPSVGSSLSTPPLEKRWLTPALQKPAASAYCYENSWAVIRSHVQVPEAPAIPPTEIALNTLWVTLTPHGLSQVSKLCQHEIPFR